MIKKNQTHFIYSFSALVVVLILIQCNMSFSDGPNKVILSPNQTSLLVNVGSDVPNIKCKANCQPDCSLTWISPNGHEESTDILIIKNIQINQTGMYKFNASNEVSHMVSAGLTITIVCMYLFLCYNKPLLYYLGSVYKSIILINTNRGLIVLFYLHVIN